MKRTKILLVIITAITTTATSFAAAGIEGPDYASSKWTGIFATKSGPSFNHLPGTICVIYHGATSVHAMSKDAFSFTQASGLDDWKPRCELNLQTAMTAQQFFD